MEVSSTARHHAKPAKSADTVAASPLPDAARYRVDLPGGAWALWRWMALRGACVPADLLLELGAPDCARAADALIEERRREVGARPHATFTVTEMLPEIEQSWLPGATDKRYTCELRMVAVDWSDHPCCFPGTRGADAI